MKKYQNIVIGAGITGITIAEMLASKGEEVLIIEKRDTIGGNCYDYFDSDKNYIQLYGPHIFHTNYKGVWDYLNRFTKFNNYSHKVLCDINGTLINIPFNLNSIDLAFDKNKAKIIKETLVKEIGLEKKVPILELRKHNNPLIRELAEYVYKDIFLNYTVKQWGIKPHEIDPSVTARVPVFISQDNRYFQDKWQGIPEKGFARTFESMLKNPKIKILLSTDFKKVISDYTYEKLYFTGALDSYFDHKHGKIKYRRINLKFKNKNTPSFQKNSVINYPNTNDFTRITEFNKFLFIKNKNTVIAEEFSSWDKGFEAYPVSTIENQKIIDTYKEEAKKLHNIVFLGRMAECKYYNMDQAIKRVFETIV